MIEHIWSVICTNSIIDRETNNVSLVDVLEQLNIPPDAQLPAVVGNPFTLVTLWSRSDLDQPARGRARLTIHNPSGQVATMPEYEIDLENYRRSRNRIGFQALQITQVGKYIFQVELLDDGSGQGPGVVAKVPIEVRFSVLENPE